MASTVEYASRCPADLPPPHRHLRRDVGYEVRWAPRFRRGSGLLDTYPTAPRTTRRQGSSPCGDWLRQLVHAHLRLHGMTAEDHRRAFGQRRRHPLQSPDLSELRRRTTKWRRADDERVKSGTETALELARSGRLVELRLAGNAETSLEATRIRRATAAAMGNARAEALRTERELACPRARLRRAGAYGRPAGARRYRQGPGYRSWRLVACLAAQALRPIARDSPRGMRGMPRRASSRATVPSLTHSATPRWSSSSRTAGGEG